MLNCQRSAAGYNSLQHRATSMCYQRPIRRGCFAERGRRLPTAGRMIHLSQQTEETHWVKSRIPQQLISATTPTFSLGKLRSEMLFDLPKVMHKISGRARNKTLKTLLPFITTVFSIADAETLQACCSKRTHYPSAGLVSASREIK